MASRYGTGSWGRTIARFAGAAALAVGWVAPNATESAIANGDTRSVWFSNQHTKEEARFTYMVNGVYDSGALDKLNWFMRDWRLDEPTKMDPRLFDIIWEVYRQSGSQQPVNVFSAYRSPQTNAMLRKRSRAVAEHSQHMGGKAIDAHFEDVGPARIRDIAMRMQRGGVGFYPQGLSWVHIDSGSVRYWPRMSRDALTRLFPDGKTVFIPADGKPMPGYELARAEIEQRGGEIQMASNGGVGGFFSWLFGRGGGADDAEESGGQEATTLVASSSNVGGRGGGQGRVVAAPATPEVEIAEAGPTAVARAKRGLPSGPTYASAAPEPATPPAPQPQVVARLDQPQASDATADAAPADAPVKLRGPVAVACVAPLPPRRPSDLMFQISALDIPLPPARPSDLVALAPPASGAPPLRPLASEATSAIAPPTPPARPPGLSMGPKFVQVARSDDLVADVMADRLPSVITRGVSVVPAAALALAEPTGVKTAVDSGPLLARAAELTAPLPPMPIPDVAAPAAPAQHSASVGGRLKGILPAWLGGQ